MGVADYVLGVFTRMRGHDYIASLCREMHAQGAFPGHSWRAHLEQLKRTVPDLDAKVILDFGCGPRGGLAECFGDKVISYDPFVAQYATLPWDRPFDVVFSSDVMEHLSHSQLDDFCARLRQAQPEYVFLNISTRRAFKNLPNGSNAHLTVKPARWWLSYLGRQLGPNYTLCLAQEDLLRNEATVCFQRTAKGPA